MKPFGNELQSLIRRASQGDAAATEEFLREIVPLIVRVVRRQLGRRAARAPSSQGHPMKARPLVRHARESAADDHELLVFQVVRRVCEFTTRSMRTVGSGDQELKNTVLNRAVAS